MIRTLTRKIALGALGLVLTGAAVAAAVGAPPDAADDGLTNAESHAGFPLPASADGHPTKDDHPGGGSEDEVDEGAPEADDADEAADSEGGPVDNHGAFVSAVAQDDSVTGRAHGKAVSEVARSDAGKPDHAGQPDDAGDEDEDEDQSAGRGHAKGHAKQ